MNGSSGPRRRGFAANGLECGVARRFAKHSDEALAVARPELPVLISGPDADSVERSARRIHESRFGSRTTFVHLRAAHLSARPQLLTRGWARLCADGLGGSLFLSDVDEVSPSLQRHLLTAITQCRTAYERDHVRLIAGTTVRLFDSVSAGTFSEELFYRLNLIHCVLKPFAGYSVGA